MLSQTVDKIFSILIIGMPRCPFCEQLKSKYLDYFTMFMNEKFKMNVYYREISNRNTAESEIMELTNSPGFPHICIIENSFIDSGEEYWTMMIDGTVLRTLIDKILEGKKENERVLERFMRDNLRVIIKSYIV